LIDVDKKGMPNGDETTQARKTRVLFLGCAVAQTITIFLVVLINKMKTTTY
jgi:hypothetical protein